MLSTSSKKLHEKERKCATRKCWMSLIVCMVSRCFSLELVLDNTCESLLMFFQKHFSKIGVPIHFLSDNVAANIRANEQMESPFKSHTAWKHYAENGIRRNFIPRRSEQHNGVTEWPVAATCKTFRRIFGASKMTEQEITTLLKLAKMKISCQLSIFVIDDPNDQNLLTITPFYLKMLKPVALLSSCLDNFTVDNLAKMKLCIREIWQKGQIFQADFSLNGRMNIYIYKK